MNVISHPHLSCKLSLDASSKSTLVEYLWTSQMQSQHDVHEELVILRRQQEDHQKLLITMQSLMIRAQSSMGLTAPQLTGTVTLASCVTLVEATGHDHAIPLNFCTSFQVCSPALNSVLWKLTDQILFSKLIRCSKFCLNVTPLKHIFRDGM